MFMEYLFKNRIIHSVRNFHRREEFLKKNSGLDNDTILKLVFLKFDKFSSCDDLVSPMHLLYSNINLNCQQYKALSILLKFCVKVTGALSCRTLPHGDTSAWNHYRTSFNRPLRNWCGSMSERISRSAETGAHPMLTWSRQTRPIRWDTR